MYNLYNRLDNENQEFASKEAILEYLETVSRTIGDSTGAI